MAAGQANRSGWYRRRLWAVISCHRLLRQTQAEYLNTTGNVFLGILKWSNDFVTETF